jgi:CheY-like chemotaxis protein
VANTLLAVDDSVTMRKVLEITFAGTEFRVITAESPDAALQKLQSEKPDLVITDVTLQPNNGYELCRAIKEVAPGVPVLILSSKQNPFDAAQANGAGADDHMDKPFDTQQMIDKVKKMMAARGDVAAAAPAASPSQQRVAPAPTAAASPAARAKTLIYQPGASPAAPAARPAGPLPGATAPAPTPGGGSFAQPTPVSGVPLQSRPAAPAPVAAPPPTPAPQHRPAAAPAASPAAAAVAAGVNGGMAGKLAEMGLTQEQADAVMSLSRDVVERVVWEVVPVLAETLIKEEIARLTK